MTAGFKPGLGDSCLGSDLEGNHLLKGESRGNANVGTREVFHDRFGKKQIFEVGLDMGTVNGMRFAITIGTNRMEKGNIIRENSKCWR